MIHFTCDGCQRRIETEQETRYVLRLEVYAATEPLDDQDNAPPADESAADRDHLDELSDLLERVDDYGDEAVDSLGDDYRHVRHDLCADCRARLLANPLGRLAVGEIGFSKN